MATCANITAQLIVGIWFVHKIMDTAQPASQQNVVKYVNSIVQQTVRMESVIKPQHLAQVASVDFLGRTVLCHALVIAVNVIRTAENVQNVWLVYMVWHAM